MATKKRVGRPKKAAATKHSKALYLKLTPDQRKSLVKAANRAGKSLSEWVREVLLNECAK